MKKFSFDYHDKDKTMYKWKRRKFSTISIIFEYVQQREAKQEKRVWKIALYPCLKCSTYMSLEIWIQTKFY